MSNLIPILASEGLPAASSPHGTADIPELDRLLSYGYSTRAAIHFEAGDLDAALVDLDVAIRLFADNPEALSLGRRIRQLRGDQGRGEVDLPPAAEPKLHGGEGVARSSECELCYQVMGHFGYNFAPVLNTFPLTPEGRREAIEYAIEAVGDTLVRSEIQSCHDYDIEFLRVEVYEHRALTVRRLIHSEEE